MPPKKRKAAGESAAAPAAKRRGGRRKDNTPEAASPPPAPAVDVFDFCSPTPRKAAARKASPVKRRRRAKATETREEEQENPGANASGNDISTAPARKGKQPPRGKDGDVEGVSVAALPRAGGAGPNNSERGDAPRGSRSRAAEAGRRRGGDDIDACIADLTASVGAAAVVETSPVDRMLHAVLDSAGRGVGDNAVYERTLVIAPPVLPPPPLLPAGEAAATAATATATAGGARARRVARTHAPPPCLHPSLPSAPRPSIHAVPAHTAGHPSPRDSVDTKRARSFATSDAAAVLAPPVLDLPFASAAAPPMASSTSSASSSSRTRGTQDGNSGRDAAAVPPPAPGPAMNPPVDADGDAAATATAALASGFDTARVSPGGASGDGDEEEAELEPARLRCGAVMCDGEVYFTDCAVLVEHRALTVLFPTPMVEGVGRVEGAARGAKGPTSGRLVIEKRGIEQIAASRPRRGMCWVLALTLDAAGITREGFFDASPPPRSMALEVAKARTPLAQGVLDRQVPAIASHFHPRASPLLPADAINVHALQILASRREEENAALARSVKELRGHVPPQASLDDLLALRETVLDALQKIGTEQHRRLAAAGRPQ